MNRIESTGSQDTTGDVNEIKRKFHLTLLLKSSDIDLMIVGDGLSYGNIVECLTHAEKTLDRPVNPTIYTSAEYSDRIKEEQSFVTRVLEQPKIMIKGVIDDVSEPQ